MPRELARLELPEFTVRTVAYAAGERLPRHAHDYSNVTAVLSGEMVEILDSREYRGRACTILFKPAGTEHANVTLGRSATLTVTVQMNAQMDNWMWFDDVHSSRAALDLMRGMNAGVAHAFLATATAAADARRGRRPQWVSHLIEKLDARFDQSLNFESLAREIGLHPVYVSRAFHEYTGRTMHDHVLTRRLSHAQHLLASTGRSISSIAAETGFADPSHLTRSFRQAFGLTPRGFRAEVKGVPFGQGGRS